MLHACPSPEWTPTCPGSRNPEKVTHEALSAHAGLLEHVPGDVIRTCRALADAGHSVHLVGGAVRDLVRGAPGLVPESLEWDMATSATPEKVMDLFPRTVPTGVKHGTVTVIAPGGRTIEVTTYRGEGGYTDGRHPDSVRFVSDIEADLARRDFTINAMALDPGSGALLDPYGGRTDLDAGVLRAVGDPQERFNEDGLRPLRAARFAAVLGLDPASGLVQAMAAATGVFARVSAERKRDEILKMMGASRPSRGLRMLEQAGYVRLLFPGLEKTVGVKQGGWHEHDVWDHTLLCVDNCPAADPRLRVAALMHDAGKPATAQADEGEARTRFHGHEKVGARMAEAWLADLRFRREDQEWICRVVRHHVVMYTPAWTGAAVRRFINRVGEKTVGAVLTLAMADVRAQGRSGHLVPLAEELGRRVREEIIGGAALSIGDLVVNGDDVMVHLGIPPGPEVGRILSRLLDEVLDDPAKNTRDVLLALASRLHGGPEEG